MIRLPTNQQRSLFGQKIARLCQNSGQGGLDMLNIKMSTETEETRQFVVALLCNKSTTNQSNGAWALAFQLYHTVSQILQCSGAV